MKYLFYLLIFSLNSYAQVRVAFIEIWGHDGKILELEEGTQFSHVAISYRGLWLHTHPYRGVEVVSSLKIQEMGIITAIIEIPDHNEPSEYFVNSVLGSPYEVTFSWESERYYCSKLVAKILDLQPEPMNFNAPAWPLYFRKFNGLPGISPQGTFRQLLKLGYKVYYPPKRCE